MTNIAEAGLCMLSWHTHWSTWKKLTWRHCSVPPPRLSTRNNSSSSLLLVLQAVPSDQYGLFTISSQKPSTSLLNPFDRPYTIPGSVPCQYRSTKVSTWTFAWGEQVQVLNMSTTTTYMGICGHRPVGNCVGLITKFECNSSLTPANQLADTFLPSFSGEYPNL